MIRKGDIVIDTQNKQNIYTVVKIRRSDSSSFLMHRWRDDKEFYFDVSASNSYFKIIGRIENEAQLRETINIERI